MSAPGRIALVAPCGPPDRGRLLQGLAQLQAWGLDWQAGPVVQAYLEGVAQPQSFLSASDGQRLEELVWALSGEFESCWAVRGGYGLTRLLERLPRRPASVRLLGFSDVTALFCWAAGGNFPALIHCANVQTLPLLEDLSLQATRQAVMGASPQPLPGRVVRSGSASGRLWGGNLCLLAHLCGTPWALPEGPKLLFLEDVNEAGYRLDRMLVQLHQSGALQEVRGLLFGEFVGCSGVEALAAEWSERLDVPLLADLPCGHGAHNHPLWLGQSAAIRGAELVWGAVP